MTSRGLKIGDSWLTFSDLKNGKTPDNTTPQEKNALQFCKSWLQGKQTFEFDTSGSTGQPKRISFRRDQLEASARLTEKALGLQPGYTALVCLDTAFIAGAMMLVRGLVAGMDLIVRTPSANPLDGISDPIDFAAFVPYQLITLLQHEAAQLGKIKTVIIGGAPLKEDVTAMLQGLSPFFYATYGMTETLTHIALQKLNGPDRQDFFQLLPGISASIDDRSCLLLSAEHLGQQPVITNDIVSLIGTDKFRWIGRYDQVINSGGIKVQAEKVEQAVAQVFVELKIEKRFFVNGVPDQKLGERVALIVEGEKLSAHDEQASQSKLREHLKEYEMPKMFLYTSHFFETATQKIDRRRTMESLLNKGNEREK